MLKNVFCIELIVILNFVLISILQNCALILAINPLKVDRISRIVLKDHGKSKSLSARRLFIRILTKFKTQYLNKDLVFQI